MKTAEKKVAEKTNNEANTVLKVVPSSDQPTPSAETPDGEKSATAKPGAKAALREKLASALTVENVSGWVEDLNYLKKSLASLNLNDEKLASFEFIQREEPEGTEANYWTGCTLTIKDDKRNEWPLKNPALIQLVVEFLHGIFEEKREELRMQILEKAQNYPF